METDRSDLHALQSLIVTLARLSVWQRSPNDHDRPHTCGTKQGQSYVIYRFAYISTSSTKLVPSAVTGATSQRSNLDAIWGKFVCITAVSINFFWADFKIQVKRTFLETHLITLGAGKHPISLLRLQSRWQISDSSSGTDVTGSEFMHFFPHLRGKILGHLIRVAWIQPYCASLWTSVLLGGGAQIPGL